MWVEQLEMIALHYVRRKQLKTLLSQMSTHISNCKLEPLMRFAKMEKIKKFYDLINIMPSIPFCTRKIYMKYLEYIWKKMVVSNGFININETLSQLEIDINKDELICGFTQQTMVTINDFKNIYLYNICPLTCVVEYKKNEANVLNICVSRPGFTDLDGKLYGLCVEINQCFFTIRIFGLIDRDTMRLYRQELPLYLLYNDIKQKYNFDKEEVEDYINSISYRDIISIDVRNLTNRVKMLKDRLPFYEISDVETISSEYLFFTDSMKNEKIN